ncbi:glucuronoxylan 4-O-methyltransferase 1-like [Arachis hypogaea]|uniref:glucuronoxylan 4-O-methyltransferase 1-like n=1 Tax=Arachis hypogaea TaxID=3818 RepID=UPI003B22506C
MARRIRHRRQKPLSFHEPDVLSELPLQLELNLFDLGHDSLMWTSFNYGGHTVFSEEDKAWIDQVQQRIPNLKSYHVAYDTNVHQADDLIKIGMEEEECKKVSDPRFSKC